MFSPLWAQSEDHCTNSTLLVVAAADDKVDTDVLRANTGLGKCLLLACVELDEPQTETLFMIHKQSDTTMLRVTDRFIWRY